MNDKIKKKDKNTKFYDDLKPVIDLTSLKSIDVEAKENLNIKQSIIMKTKKINEDINLPFTSVLNSTKINRSFSIDLNRKQDCSPTYNPQSTSNNVIKVKDNINHRVIKLYSLSPVKYKSIDTSKEQLPRDISFNKLPAHGVQKKSPKIKNDIYNKHNQSVFHVIMNKSSNTNSSAINQKKLKSQNSYNYTTSTGQIMGPSDLSSIGNLNSSKNKDIKQQNNSKISLKINNNSKNKNKKIPDNDKELLNDTARASLSLFKITLNDLVNRNKNNITFVKELERTFKNFISQSITRHEHSNYFDANETITSEEFSKNDYHKIISKAEFLERKVHNVVDENSILKEKIKDQARQLNQMKRILSNFQSQIKGITDFNANGQNQTVSKQENKSKSVLGNISNKNKINISLYKYDDKSELQKSPFAEKKSSGNIGTLNKNECVITLNSSESGMTREDPKSSAHKKRTKTYQTSLKTKENILENSITSIGSENSADNAREMLYFHNSTSPQKKANYPKIPKLKLNKSNNENYKQGNNTDNNTEKNENRSDNTSMLTPESKLEYKHLQSEEMNMNLSFNLYQNKGNSSGVERARSTSDIYLKTKSPNGKNPNSTNFLINLENLPKLDYNEEFLSKFEEFSPSWRNECKKLKGLNIGNENDILKIEKTES